MLIMETPTDVTLTGEDQNSDTPATQGPRSPLGSGVVTFLSTINVATLLSLSFGLCYFYSHAYHEAYLGRFGLDSNAIPVAVQDAIVDGFLGLNQNVLWLLVIFAVVIVAYVAAIWFGSRWLEKIASGYGITDRPGAPPAMLVEFGRSGGFRASLLAAAAALAMTVTSGAALIFVGSPADAAGSRAAAQLRGQVRSNKALCVRYSLKGKAEIVGRSIGSSAERQFILGNDDAVHVVKFDDMDKLYQTPVRCR